jgi:hypothetical protein
MMTDKKYTLEQYSAMQGGHAMPTEENGTQLSFIQSLGEARMFKTKQQIKGEGARSLTDHLFVSMLSLYSMSTDYKTAPQVAAYARRTNMYGGFNRPSPSGTDVYQTLFTLSKPTGLADSPADKLLLAKVNLDQRKIKQFMKMLETGKVNPGQASAFLYKLEKQLAITDPKLRAARRLIGDWTTASTQQRQLAATQLNKYYRMSARRSDLNPIFKKFTDDNGLVMGAKKKRSIKATIARKVGAFAAGYAAGSVTGM